MIEGLVSCVHQREHQQRKFLAMMSSANGTIKNWSQSLCAYPKAFQAGYKSNPDSTNFMEAMNGEHDEQYQEAMGIEMQAFNRQSHGILCQKVKHPQPPMFSTSDMGIQAQVLPRWSPQEVQGLIVHQGRQTNQRN